MHRFFFILLPILFGVPQFTMKWIGTGSEQVMFQINRHDPLVFDCQKSGSEVFYRYEYKLCKRRQVWFDSCGDSTIETRTLREDPITETFTVTADRWGDTAPAVTSPFTTLEEAYEELSTIRSIEVNSKNETEDARSRRYIRLRAKFICKGQTNATLDRISSIVTLGLVSVGTTDTGWIDFTLDDSR